MEEQIILTEVENEMFKLDEEKKSRFLRPTDTAEILMDFLWQEFELSRMSSRLGSGCTRC